MSFSENGSPVFIDPSVRKRGLLRPDPAPRYSPLLSSVEVVKRIVHAALGSVEGGDAKATSGTRFAGPTAESEDLKRRRRA